MRVSTRIAAGYGVLIVLAVAVLIYQVLIINEMNSINKELADLNVGQVGEVLTDLQLRADQDLVDDAASKFILTQIPQYSGLLRSYVQDMETHLQKLKDNAATDEERMTVDRLTQELQNLQTRSLKPRTPSQEMPEWYRP